MELAYYPGCSLKESSSLYDVQNRLVFSKLGIELKEIEDWGCCGATSAGKVDDFLAIAMPARNLGIAESSGHSEMIIPCSACYSRTMVARERLAADNALKSEINAGLEKPVTGTIKISSILEVLLTQTESGELAKKVVHKFKGFKPVCYYGCLLTRFPCTVPVPDDVENPMGMEKILEAVGIHPLDWNCKTSCCGASAAVNDAATATTLMAAIVRDALEHGADCLVATCPLCQFNMDAQQEKVCKENNITERLPVFFLTEIVGTALGLSIKELQIDRHFVDGTGLLEELETDEQEE